MIVIGKRYDDVVQIVDSPLNDGVNICATPEGRTDKSVLLNFDQQELRKLIASLETFVISEG